MQEGCEDMIYTVLMCIAMTMILWLIQIIMIKNLSLKLNVIKKAI